VDSPTARERAARTILFTGVGANLVAVGFLVWFLFMVQNNACLDSFSPYCFVPSILDNWLLATVVILGTLPLLSLAGPRLALAGMLAQDLLLFLSAWIFFIWGLFPLVFSLFGALIAWIGCGLFYRKGFPGPPVPTMMLGASWAGMLAIWMVYLAYSPAPTSYVPYSCGNLGPPVAGCLAPAVTPLVAAEWALPALILTTALALIPVVRPRIWLAGLAGSLGVMIIGVLVIPYFAALTPFAIFAGLVLAIGGRGYAEFARTGRSLGQLIDGAPPSNRARGTEPPA
jgi:hypothetical protein